MLNPSLRYQTSWTYRLYSFYINLPCGAVAAAAVFLFLRIPKDVKPAQATLKEKILQMDLTGVILITAAVVCYLLALQWGGISKGWSSSDVVGLLVDFGILFIAFLSMNGCKEKEHCCCPA